MTAREMWVSEIEGSDEMKAPAFTVRIEDEGVCNFSWTSIGR